MIILSLYFKELIPTSSLITVADLVNKKFKIDVITFL